MRMFIDFFGCTYLFWCKILGKTKKHKTFISKQQLTIYLKNKLYNDLNLFVKIDGEGRLLPLKFGPVLYKITA